MPHHIEGYPSGTQQRASAFDPTKRGIVARTVLNNKAIIGEELTAALIAAGYPVQGLGRVMAPSGFLVPATEHHPLNRGLEFAPDPPTAAYANTYSLSSGIAGQPMPVIIDGQLVMVGGSRVGSTDPFGRGNDNDEHCTITLGAPPGSGTRIDLVFLEMWYQEVTDQDTLYPWGNTQYLGTAITNDLRHVSYRPGPIDEIRIENHTTAGVRIQAQQSIAGKSGIAPGRKVKILDDNTPAVEYIIHRVDADRVNNKYIYLTTSVPGNLTTDQNARIQLFEGDNTDVVVRYRIRIAEGKNAINDSNVFAQGAKDAVTSLPFTHQPNDPALYRAGSGESSRAALGTTDGYVYALAMQRIYRRNTTAHNFETNPAGAGAAVGGTSDRSDGKFNDIIYADDVEDVRLFCYLGDNFDKRGVLNAYKDTLMAGEARHHPKAINLASKKVRPNKDFGHAVLMREDTRKKHHKSLRTADGTGVTQGVQDASDFAIGDLISQQDFRNLTSELGQTLHGRFNATTRQYELVGALRSTPIPLQEITGKSGNDITISRPFRNLNMANGAYVAVRNPLAAHHFDPITQRARAVWTNQRAQQRMARNANISNSAPINGILEVRSRTGSVGGSNLAGDVRLSIRKETGQGFLKEIIRGTNGTVATAAGTTTFTSTQLNQREATLGTVIQEHDIIRIQPSGSPTPQILDDPTHADWRQRNVTAKGSDTSVTIDGSASDDGTGLRYVVYRPIAEIVHAAYAFENRTAAGTVLTLSTKGDVSNFSAGDVVTIIDDATAPIVRTIAAGGVSTTAGTLTFETSVPDDFTEAQNARVYKSPQVFHSNTSSSTTFATGIPARWTRESNGDLTMSYSGLSGNFSVQFQIEIEPSHAGLLHPPEKIHKVEINSGGVLHSTESGSSNGVVVVEKDLQKDGPLTFADVDDATLANRGAPNDYYVVAINPDTRGIEDIAYVDPNASVTGDTIVEGYEVLDARQTSGASITNLIRQGNLLKGLTSLSNIQMMRSAYNNLTATGDYFAIEYSARPSQALRVGDGAGNLAFLHGDDAIYLSTIGTGGGESGMPYTRPYQEVPLLGAWENYVNDGLYKLENKEPLITSLIQTDTGWLRMPIFIEDAIKKFTTATVSEDVLESGVFWRSCNPTWGHDSVTLTRDGSHYTVYFCLVRNVDRERLPTPSEIGNNMIVEKGEVLLLVFGHYSEEDSIHTYTNDGNAHCAAFRTGIIIS